MATGTAEYAIDADGMVNLGNHTRIASEAMRQSLQAQDLTVTIAGDRLIVDNIPLSDKEMAYIRAGFVPTFGLGD